jgi:hypothetical protein
MKPFLEFLLRCCRCGRRFESWAEGMSRDERENAVCAACLDESSKVNRVLSQPIYARQIHSIPQTQPHATKQTATNQAARHSITLG